MLGYISETEEQVPYSNPVVHHSPIVSQHPTPDPYQSTFDTHYSAPIVHHSTPVPNYSTTVAHHFPIIPQHPTPDPYNVYSLIKVDYLFNKTKGTLDHKHKQLEILFEY